jgi:hypothetical protein
MGNKTFLKNTVERPNFRRQDAYEKDARKKARRTVAGAAGFSKRGSGYAPLASFNVRCLVSGAHAIDTSMPISKTAASTIMVA